MGWGALPAAWCLLSAGSALQGHPVSCGGFPPAPLPPAGPAAARMPAHLQRAALACRRPFTKRTWQPRRLPLLPWPSCAATPPASGRCSSTPCCCRWVPGCGGGGSACATPSQLHACHDCHPPPPPAGAGAAAAGGGQEERRAVPEPAGRFCRAGPQPASAPAAGAGGGPRGGRPRTAGRPAGPFNAMSLPGLGTAGGSAASFCQPSPLPPAPPRPAPPSGPPSGRRTRWGP